MARLLVLWILNERSSYGYEIKRALTRGGLDFWFGLEDASIYSVLRTLVRHGHAVVVGVERDGARPPRTRFAITDVGRNYYREQLVAATRTAALPTHPVDVLLAAGGDLPPGQIARALLDREEALAHLREQIEEHRRAAPADAISNRAAALVDAERAWLARHIAELNITGDQ